MKKILIVLVLAIIYSCSKSSGTEPTPQPKPEPEIVNKVPSVPLMIFPTNNLLCSENPLEFRWNHATDEDGDPITYEIEIAKDQLFTELIEKKTLTETSVIYSLEKGVELNWRLRAKDDKNEFSNYSPTWKFYTEGEGIINYIPFTPTYNKFGMVFQ